MDQDYAMLLLRVERLERLIAQGTAMESMRTVEAITLADAATQIAAHYGYTLADIQSRSRVAELCEARHAICWVLRELGWTRRSIATVIGLTQSAVTYGVSVVDGWTGKRASRVGVLAEMRAVSRV